MPKLFLCCLLFAVRPSSCSVDDVELLQLNAESATEEGKIWPFGSRRSAAKNVEGDKETASDEPRNREARVSPFGSRGWAAKNVEGDKETASDEKAFRMPRNSKEARKQRQQHAKELGKARNAARKQERLARKQERLARKAERKGHKEEKAEAGQAKSQTHMEDVKAAEKVEQNQEASETKSVSADFKEEEAAAVSTSLFIPASDQKEAQNEAEETEKPVPVQMSTTPVPLGQGEYFYNLDGKDVVVNDKKEVESREDYTLRDMVALEDEEEEGSDNGLTGWQEAFREGKIRTPELEEQMQGAVDPSTVSRVKDELILRRSPDQFKRVPDKKTRADRLLRRSVEKSRTLDDNSWDADGCDLLPSLCESPFNCQSSPVQQSEKDGWQYRLATLDGHANTRYFCKDFGRSTDRETAEDLSFMHYTQSCMTRSDATSALVQAAYRTQVRKGTADIMASYCVMEGFCQRMNHDFLSLNVTGTEILCSTQYGDAWKDFGLEHHNTARWVIQGKLSKKDGMKDKTVGQATGLKACAVGSYSCDAHFCQQTYCKDEHFMAKYEHLVEYE